jgi:hypothetical protein
MLSESTYIYLKLDTFGAKDVNVNLQVLIIIRNMLIPILLFDVALVAWSLHLMEKAYEHKEFSLMLAGTLVALAAAAMLVVYFLMGNCLSYLLRMS